MSSANTSASIPLRKRPDLLYSYVVYRGEASWVVKDPLELKYHVLNEEEYAILDWLSKPITFEQLQTKFERKFSPHRARFRELQDFLISLHQKSLLIATAGGQGRFLAELAKTKKRKEISQKLKSITHLKFRGIHPGWLLDNFGGLFQWVFSTPAVIVALSYAVFAALLALVYAEEIAARMPTFSSFFGPENWARLFVVTMVTKVIHEFGHALAFRQFGGRCHEIGVMIMFFVPTLFCNTSDSWMLKSKWQRAAIGLGGIYVELITMSIATTVWCVSQTSDLQLWAMQIMFVSSISTVLINGNPLVKYDGYFVLSDLLEIPNMATKANTVIRKSVLRFIWGDKNEVDYWTPAYLQRWLATYAIAAFVYRIFLTTSIGLFLMQMLSPFGLSWAAAALCAFTCGGLIIAPCFPIGKRIMQPGATLSIKHKRGFAIIGSILVAVLLLGFIPLPYSLCASYELGMDQSKSLYCTQSGKLVEVLVEEGESVEENQLIARLEDLELSLQQLSLSQENERLVGEIDSLLRSTNRSDKESLSLLEQQLQSNEDQLELVNQKLAQLEIRAPQAGIFYRTTSRARESHSSEELVSWEGQPLRQSNVGAMIERGTALGVLGGREELVARIKIPQRDISLVKSAANVRLMQSSYVHEILHGKVSHISPADANLEDLPPMLRSEETQRAGQAGQASQQSQSNALGDVPTPNADLLEEHFYMVAVNIDEQSGAVIGSSGLAKIYVGNRSLWWRGVRLLLNTIDIRL